MTQAKDEQEEDGGEYDKKDEQVRAIFNQADRDKLILLGRWSENNRGHGQEGNWEDFNKESFNAFVRKVDDTILDEILEELTYLPSDWIVSFRKEAEQVKELEWRKVLRAIGLKADAIQSLEINDVCDFATLNYTSKKWKISEPREWQKMGLRENDVRHGRQSSAVHSTRDLFSGISTQAN